MADSDAVVNGDGERAQSYVNFLISPKSKISELLDVYGNGPEALDKLLMDDFHNAQQQLSSIYWYHGALSRDEAEELLQAGGNSLGLFLVRDSNSAPGNYVISLTVKGKPYHYQISECGDVYFNIDGGQIFHGIENLINHHRNSAHGLPTKLRKFVPKDPPPPSACRYGWTNLLHRAVLEGNTAIVKKILNSELCPDINEKTSEANHGTTALHDAAFNGYDAIILLLLEKGPDVHARDNSSMTPLHKACEGNKPNSVKVLIEKGNADPHQRSVVDGCVPMHVAAMLGHTQCIEVLLSFNAPCWPRNEDDSTPYQLAERCGHKEAATLLKEYRSPKPKVYMADWYHKDLKREEVNDKMKEAGDMDGLFLVRDSSKHPHWHVLAIMFKGGVFNFEIKTYDKRVFFFIDDGPLFETLELVVEHYSRRADGLPCKLTYALTPEGTVLDIHESRPHTAVGIKEGEKQKTKGKIPPPLDLKPEDLTHLSHSSGCMPPPTSPTERRPSLPPSPTQVMLINDSPKRPSLPDALNPTLSRSPSPGYLNPDTARQPVIKGKESINSRGPCPLPNVVDGSSSFPPPHRLSHENLSDKPLLKKPHGLSGPFVLPNKIPSPVTPPKTPPKDDGTHKMNSPKLKNSNLLHPADRPAMPIPTEKSSPGKKQPPGPSPPFLPSSLKTFPPSSSHNTAFQFPYADPKDLSKPPSVPAGTERPSSNITTKHQRGMSEEKIHQAPDVIPKEVVESPKSIAENFKNIFKKNKKPKDKESQAVEKDTSGTSPPGDKNQFLLIPYNKIKLASEELGQGEFGSVYKGTWKKENGEKVPVAVKTLHPENIFSGKEQFLAEAKVMAGLDHPCIVKLMGVSEGKLLLIVQELVTMGSMLDYLYYYQDKIDVRTDLYLWAAQIACGMMYLERKKFVHRDLAARNILLASTKQIKISDFGLSRAVGANSDYYQASKGGRWPVKWYAPECVLYGTFSHASDVWSFGVTLWEMFSFGGQPYEDVPATDVIDLLEKGDRLEQPEKCPDSVYNTMNKCWKFKASDRPTFDELNTRFEADPDYASINDLVIGR